MDRNDLWCTREEVGEVHRVRGDAVLHTGSGFRTLLWTEMAPDAPKRLQDEGDVCGEGFQRTQGASGGERWVRR